MVEERGLHSASQWGKRVLNARMVEVPDATQWETVAMRPILVSSIFLAAWLLGGTTVRRASAIIQALILLYSVVLAGWQLQVVSSFLI